MHKGTLIDDLIAVVERVEEHARVMDEVQELEQWFMIPQKQVQFQQDLLGVA